MSPRSSREPSMVCWKVLLFLAFGVLTPVHCEVSPLLHMGRSLSALSLAMSIPHRYLFDENYTPLGFLQMSYLAMEAVVDNNNFNYEQFKNSEVETYLDWSNLDFFSNFLDRKTQYFQIAGSRFSYFVAMCFVVGFTSLIQRFMRMVRYRQHLGDAWQVLQALFDWIFSIMWYHNLEYVLWQCSNGGAPGFDFGVALFMLVSFSTYLGYTAKKVWDLHHNDQVRILEIYKSNPQEFQEAAASEGVTASYKRKKSRKGNKHSTVSIRIDQNRHSDVQNVKNLNNIRHLQSIMEADEIQVTPEVKQEQPGSLMQIVKELPSSKLLQSEQTLELYNKRKKELVYLTRCILVATCFAVYSMTRSEYWCLIPCYAGLFVLQIYSYFAIKDAWKIRKVVRGLTELCFIALSVLYSFLKISYADYLIYGVYSFYLLIFLVQTVFLISHVHQLRLANSNQVSAVPPTTGESPNQVQTPGSGDCKPMEPVMLELTAQVFEMPFDKNSAFRKRYRNRREAVNKDQLVKEVSHP